MNKAELSEKWSKYTDTNKLVDDISALLTEYNHRNTEHGVCTLLDTYFTNKEPLIKMFEKSENYAGNMRIVLSKEIERTTMPNDLYSFVNHFCTEVGASDAILSKKDKDGKGFTDYICTGVKTCNINDLLNDEFIQGLKGNSDKLNQFTSSGYTRESSKKLNAFSTMINCFRSYSQSSINVVMAETIKGYDERIKLHTNSKTSRAFNKICEMYGINKLPKYNKLFAEYSDMVNQLKRKMNYVISLNPYDYLTMSFGKNWASCHTIDKTNRRGMDNSYQGMYCGGTLSYMLDEVSIIVYTVNPDDDIQTSGKIYRNMFHFANNVLIQGRIYPQGNDGSTDLYKVFRTYMQDELAVLMGLENNLWTKSNRSPSEYIAYSQGAHYRDYDNFNDCNVSYPSEKKDELDSMVIGHTGICAKCGNEIESNDRIVHNYNCNCN